MKLFATFHGKVHLIVYIDGTVKHFLTKASLEESYRRNDSNY